MIALSETNGDFDICNLIAFSTFFCNVKYFYGVKMQLFFSVKLNRALLKHISLCCLSVDVVNVFLTSCLHIALVFFTYQYVYILFNVTYVNMKALCVLYTVKDLEINDRDRERESQTVQWQDLFLLRSHYTTAMLSF